MRPYNDLANAVILMAINDYKTLLERPKYLSKEPRFNERRIADAEKEINKIEEFFKSERYDLMTNISGKEVMKKIRMKVEQ